MVFWQDPLVIIVKFMVVSSPRTFVDQFEHYTCIGGSPSSPEKPPKFALFESKKFKNYIITWDLPEDTTDHGDESMENVVKCEVR